MEITSNLENIGKKYANENYSNLEGNNFTENMFQICDSIIMSNIGWKEISLAEQRYTATSQVLTIIDIIGHIYLQKQTPFGHCVNHSRTYSTDNLNIQLTTFPQFIANGSFCFIDASNSICFPDTALNGIEEDCIRSVAAFVYLDNEDSNMLPPLFSSQASNKSLVTGLSLNNGSTVTISDNEEPIKVLFGHPAINNVDIQRRSCAFWDLNKQVWLNDGCFFNVEESKLDLTVCNCYHLTNFGIFMDMTGE